MCDYFVPIYQHVVTPLGLALYCKQRLINILQTLLIKLYDWGYYPQYFH